MPKRKVKNIPLTRMVQAFLTINAGTGGEASDMARAIFGMLTGYNPGGYTIGGSIDQAIAHVESNEIDAVIDAGKVLLITQMLITLAGFMGLPKRSKVWGTDSTNYYVMWR